HTIRCAATHSLLPTVVPATVTLPANGCTVTGGQWLDPYTNQLVTGPSNIDIDHMVLEFPRSCGHLPFAAEGAGRSARGLDPTRRGSGRGGGGPPGECSGAGNRRYPIAQLARDLRISESCLRNWLAADQIEAGEKAGLTKAEREELVRLRRENRVLRM